jgi:hypothetical protein
MADLDKRIDRVRTEFDELLASARERLLAGASLERIQRHYVTRAFLVLEDAEAQAILAAADDRAALESLDESALKLAELHAALIAEFPP